MKKLLAVLVTILVYITAARASFLYPKASLLTLVVMSHVIHAIMNYKSNLELRTQIANLSSEMRDRETTRLNEIKIVGKMMANVGKTLVLDAPEKKPSWLRGVFSRKKKVG